MTIRRAEHSPLCLDDSYLHLGLAEYQRSVVGKIVRTRDIHTRTVKKTLAKSWNLPNLKVIRTKSNIFQFILSRPEDIPSLFARAPWCWDNALLVLKPWKPIDADPEYFTKFHFWFHIVGFPREFHTMPIAKKIANTLDACVECQIREDVETGIKFFRFKAQIDVTQPLHRVFVLRHTLWDSFSMKGSRIFASTVD